LLRQHGLPATLGAECAARFHDYAATELADARSMGSELRMLRTRDCRLAVVTNGEAPLQQRKLRMLGLEELFDMCIYCDPAKPEQLKPAAWAWGELLRWRDGLPTAYVGDVPVDEKFALAGAARFVGFRFRNPRYGN
jgi:FMN phosphatase YigB (HAD superfamily)